MSSENEANQTQTSEQQDNRIAAATGSANLVLTRSEVGGNVNVTTVSTDHGAVDKSFDFANRISQGAADTAAASMSNVKAVSMSAIDAVKDAYHDSAEQIAAANDKVTSTLADAYKTAKAGEQKMLAGGLAAVVALVAVKVFGKG